MYNTKQYKENKVKLINISQEQVLIPKSIL